MADTGRASRRRFLARAAAATVGTVAVAGCGGIFGDGNEPRDRTDGSPGREQSPEGDRPATATSTPGTATPPSPFDSRADLTEHGADPTGSEPVGDVIEDTAESGRLLYLPPGEYRVDGEIVVSDLDRFGLVGEDATLVPSEDLGSTVAIFRSDDALLVENLHFDFTGEKRNARAIDARAPDGLTLRDVSVAGRLEDGRGPIRVDVTDDDGSGLVERLELPDGSAAGESVTGCYVGDENRGEITFRDCHVEGFADNGLYGDPNFGRIVVEGGYYANNGISNVRVRAGSVVRNVHVRCDDGSRELDNMRGIRLTNSERRPDAPPAVVENCRVEMIAVTYSDGAITLDSSLPAARIRDTEIQMDADDVQAIWAKSPVEELEVADSDYTFDAENVVVTGEANGGPAIQIDGRDGSLLEQIEVIQTAADRNGLSLQRSNENVLRDSVLDVGGVPIVLRQATLEAFDSNVGPDVIHSKTIGDDEA